MNQDHEYWKDESDGYHTTITAEGIHQASYVVWNILTAPFGAMASFVWDGTSLYHFNDSAKATKFALAQTIVPNAPKNRQNGPRDPTGI